MKAEHKYTANVYVIPYEDTTLFRNVADTIATCNLSALDMEGSPLRSLVNIHLTEEQQKDDSETDVLTGFHITDGAFRLVVVEGICGGVAMETLNKAVQR